MVVRETKQLKGINKEVIKQTIKHENYKRCSSDELELYAEMNSLRTDNHIMQTTHSVKLALNHFDDKRWLMDDGVTSYPYGHYKLDNN